MICPEKDAQVMMAASTATQSAKYSICTWRKFLKSYLHALKMGIVKFELGVT